MKSIVMIFFLLLATGVSYGQNMKSVSEKSVVQFEFVKKDVKGSVTGLEAEITFDEANTGAMKIQGKIPVKNLSTENKKRDEHLKSSDYFDATKHPFMYFTSNGIDVHEKGFKMAGILKIKNIEKKCVWYFSFQDGVFKGRTVINSKDFGIMDSEVRITVTVPVVQQ
jgi:polyisoprenoid-binding protein YceI